MARIEIVLDSARCAEEWSEKAVIASRLWHTKPEQKAQLKTLKWGDIEKAVF